MGEIINATFTPKQTDGGKARHHRRRFKFSGLDAPKRDVVDDLAMDHADQMDYMPSEYVAPVWDPG